MAGWQAVVHSSNCNRVDGLLCPVRTMHGNLGYREARDQFVEVGRIHVYIGAVAVQQIAHLFGG